MLRLILFAVVVTSLCSCKTISTREVAFERHPIGLRVLNRVIDEYEGTTEYSLLFRNNGREIISFDYTVADRLGVPHVDKDGPNSGLIENLYPGAEIEVPNPIAKMTVHVTLGTVTYGKKGKDELTATYQTDSYLKRQEVPDGGEPGLSSDLLDPYEATDDGGGL